MECLGNEGVGLVDFRRLEREKREALETYFDTEIAVLLSPIIVGKRQPFPFLRGGKSMQLEYWRKKWKGEAGHHSLWLG